MYIILIVRIKKKKRNHKVTEFLKLLRWIAKTEVEITTEETRNI